MHFLVSNNCALSMFGCIIMQRQSYGMRTKLRVREMKNKTTFTEKNIYNIFQVICSVISFKLPKWMGDNYVWCLNDCDRRTCYMLMIINIGIINTDTDIVMIKFYWCHFLPHQLVESSSLAVRITTSFTNSFHVWLASHIL